MSFAVVVAADSANGIGKDGDLAWRLPGDLAFFRRLTTTARPGVHNAVVMGRRTWQSIPAKFRPLPGRLNLVVSRDAAFEPGGRALVATSLEEALARAASEPDVAAVFVIGGGELYRAALAHPECRAIYLTRIEGTYGCDTFFPALPSAFERTEASPRQEENGIGYVFEIWRRTTSNG